MRPYLLRCDALEDRAMPSASLATGAAAGQQPTVTVYDINGQQIAQFLAYDPGYTGGVNVAVADVTGDDVPDIVTAPNAGGSPNVRVFDGSNSFALVRSFYAFDPGFLGGVSLATAKVTAVPQFSRVEDIIVGAGAGGGPQVKVFQGGTGVLVKSFNAFDSGFRGGVSVAAKSGYWYTTPVPVAVYPPGYHPGPLPPPPPPTWVPGTITAGAGPGGGPHVVQLDGDTLAVKHSFYAFDPSFRGGVNVAALSGTLMVGAGDGGTSNVRAFTENSTSQLVLSGSFSVGSGTHGVIVGTDGATLFTITSDQDGLPVVKAFSVTTTYWPNATQTDTETTLAEKVFAQTPANPGVTNWGRVGSFPKNG